MGETHYLCPPPRLYAESKPRECRQLVVREIHEEVRTSDVWTEQVVVSETRRRRDVSGARERHGLRNIRSSFEMDTEHAPRSVSSPFLDAHTM